MQLFQRRARRMTGLMALPDSNSATQWSSLATAGASTWQSKTSNVQRKRPSTASKHQLFESGNFCQLLIYDSLYYVSLECGWFLPVNLFGGTCTRRRFEPEEINHLHSLEKNAVHIIPEIGCHHRPTKRKSSKKSRHKRVSAIRNSSARNILYW